MKKLLGIDIGSHELKIAEFNGKTVSKLISAATPDNLIKDGTILSFNGCADFIKSVITGNNISIKDASVILPEREVYLKRINVPYMDKKKLLVNIPYELHDYLDQGKDEYIYDYTVNETILDEKGKPVQMDITAAAVLKSTIHNYSQMLKKAGLKMSFAIPNESVFTNIINMLENSESKEFAFADIGQMGTRLVIYSGSKYETIRIVENGLEKIDEAISNVEKVGLHVANSYKVNNQNNVLDREPVGDAFGSIATEIRRAVNFYALNKKDTSLDSLYLCGGGACIKQLCDIIDEATDVSVIQASELLSYVDCHADDISKFTNAIGAAIQNKGMNLISREKESLNPKIVIPSIAVLLALVALFSKVAIFDRYQTLNKYRYEAAQLQAYNNELRNNTVYYDSISEQYKKFSTNFMSDSEKSMVSREEMLNLMEQEFSRLGRIVSFTSNGNVMTINIAGITLDDTSKLIETLQSRDDVLSVSISTAVSETVEEATKAETNNNDDGDNNSDTEEIVETVVSITIVMTSGGDNQ